jgi:hypothetical protein
LRLLFSSGSKDGLLRIRGENAVKQCHTSVFLIGMGVCANVLAESVAAETVYDISVVQDGVVNVTEYPLMPGRHDVVMGVSEWSAPSPHDPSSPFRGLHGICFGMTEFQGDEVVGGSGYCTYKDAEGDTYVSTWIPRASPAPGKSAGEWTAVGGTGKFEGATGSGVYETVRVSGDTRQRTLTGKITLRD